MGSLIPCTGANVKTHAGHFTICATFTGPLAIETVEYSKIQMVPLSKQQTLFLSLA